MVLAILTAVYVFCAVMLAVFGLGQLALLLAYFRYRNHSTPTPHIDDWPAVTVQLPVYNERYVIGRLLEAVAALDYPRDKLFVQVLDDSTDDTSAVISEYVTVLNRGGLHIAHLQRPERTGHKAGALEYGLKLSDTPFVALFDADFIPPPDFLRRTVPHLVTQPHLAVAQSRWGHLNTFANWLTRSQAISIDAHFVIEQTARCRAGWLFTFNGTGGVWRREAIDDAGGWSAETLTEDLDLSYRAQLRGWRFLMLPDLVVPGEVPPQMAAYKRQQARWAKGSTQTFLRIMPRLWHPAARLTLLQRFMGTVHLGQYIPNLLMLLLLILTPPLMLAGVLAKLPLAPLGLVGLIPPFAYAVGQVALYPDWLKRLLIFPALLAISTGVSITNTRAVIGALTGAKTEFLRTPKFGNHQWADAWVTLRYALRHDGIVWAELAMAVYALVGALLAAQVSLALVPYLALYAAAFGIMAFLGLRDLLLLRRVSSARRRHLALAKPAAR